MQRRLFTVASAVTMVLVLAAPASAGPTRVPAPAPEFVLEGSCTFPIAFTWPSNDEYSLLFGDPSNPTSIITTGSLWVTLTNTSNDHSVTLNISGPGRLDRHADGSTRLTAWGTWLFFFGPDQLGPGIPGSMTLVNGRTVIDTAADGFHQTIVSRVGTRADVCAMLA